LIVAQILSCQMTKQEPRLLSNNFCSLQNINKK
jgi:hypothetical protein